MKLRLAMIAALALCLAAALPAQTPTGTLKGTVADPSGGSIAGAKVKLTNNGTSETKELITDEGGRYVQPLLNPGAYTVEVQATGFAPARQEII